MWLSTPTTLMFATATGPHYGRSQTVRMLFGMDYSKLYYNQILAFTKSMVYALHTLFAKHRFSFLVKANTCLAIVID